MHEDLTTRTCRDCRWVGSKTCRGLHPAAAVHCPAFSRLYFTGACEDCAEDGNADSTCGQLQCDGPNRCPAIEVMASLTHCDATQGQRDDLLKRHRAALNTCGKSFAVTPAGKDRAFDLAIANDRLRRIEAEMAELWRIDHPEEDGT